VENILAANFVASLLEINCKTLISEMMEKRTLNRTFKLLLAILILFVTACSKDDDDTSNNNNNNTSSGGDQMLVIENGAQSVEMEKTSGKQAGTVTYSAVLVDTDGNATIATGLTWTSTDDNVVAIASSGAVTIKGTGTTIIKASITVDGVTYSASVPLKIYIPELFTVVPGVIIMTPGETIDLTPVFFTTETSISYTYSSSDASIASVNSSGVVTSVKDGTVDITVTASTSQGDPTVIVPVLVISEPDVPLPVTQVKVTPEAADIFRGQTVQLAAKAYDPADNEVSETFTWGSLDETIATVDANGLVSAVAIGHTYIQAKAKGIIGQAEIQVFPDTVVIVDPFYVSLGLGATKQFTAKAYDAKQEPISELTGVTNFEWEIPSFGAGFEMFDIATVDANGLVTINSNATLGMSSFLIANVTGSETAVGGALVSVSIFSTDCGTGNPDVASIEVTNGPIILLSFTGSPTGQVNAVAKDSGGNTVSSPALKYNSDDTAVVMVDADTGELNAVGTGIAAVTVCSGDYASTTVTVQVDF